MQLMSEYFPYPERSCLKLNTLSGLPPLAANKRAGRSCDPCHFTRPLPLLPSPKVASKRVKPGERHLKSTAANGPIQFHPHLPRLPACLIIFSALPLKFFFVFRY
jgi:hypothetical protein